MSTDWIGRRVGTLDHRSGRARAPFGVVESECVSPDGTPMLNLRVGPNPHEVQTICKSEAVIV